MNKIKVISDLHLERKIGFIKFKKNDIGGTLLLAGDIGSPLHSNYWDFLKYSSDNFEKVFFITGNHEYWNDNNYTMNDINNIIEEKSSEIPNIEFLNNKKVFYNDYNILGTTLWSNTINNKSYNYVKTNYSDTEKFNKEYHNYLFTKNVKWIENNIDNDIPTIMLTHHLPSFKLNFFENKYLPFRTLFASDLEYLIHEPIKYWIFGHTHSKFKRKINNVTCIVNAHNSYREPDLIKLE